MNKSSDAAASPYCRGRSKKPNLRSSKSQPPSHVEFSSKTPEKPPQRIRNRGVALSVADIRKAACKRLQDQKQCTETTSSSLSSSSSLSKSVRRQISLGPSSPSKPMATEDESSNLPEKYEILDEFFNRLDTLVSLHRLKRWTPTFTSFSSRIESLTDRRFTHSHLAQLKFILRKAIVLRKHLVLDERTSCMKPDIHISLDPDAVEADAAKLPPQGGRVSLKKVFRARLKEFWESHPEGDEIPEGTLPEPFNRQKKDSVVDMLETPLPTKLPPCMRYSDIVNNADLDEKLYVPVNATVEFPNEHLAAPSHMAPSFRADDVQQNPLLDSLQPLAFPVSESSQKENPPLVDTESHLKTSPAKFSSEASSSESCLTICASLESSSPHPATPSKTIEYTEKKDGSLKSIDAMSTPTSRTNKYTENKDGSLESIDATSTPAKLVSTPIRLMSATPALRSPKRRYMSPDDHSISSLNKLARHPSRSRSLKFDTPVKNKDDISDTLQEEFIQSIREKERLAMEERDPAITQAKKRKKNIASIPKLFDMIRGLLRQRNCITKAELVSKIISTRCDIADRSEVEEQLNLLQELAPEWIYEKHVYSGDLLLFINKMLSPETVRASLEEAT
ncbi:CDT1-like protein a, chloroplastic [Glycine soja]|uniref:CDT1-like protein b isoform A n=1 Tax=Glycine soja TaxID=3848 RepID=A0A445HEX0_GLYSO|nr:CDT1-like protein a, chloroplastic [Glycine soja]KHN44974.1 CDT1-like protein b [Glycine soja]RZB72147.1 CDT1-like protein b isoform A [Glycine soja]